MNDPICPRCQGVGANEALVCGRRAAGGFCDQRRLKCSTCGGRGRVTRELLLRIQEGERLRRDRVARSISLREEAKRLGISPVELSHREQGR